MLLEINPGLVIWTIVTFVVLLVLLGRLAWRPILAALDKRERTLRETLDEAQRTRSEAERLFAEYSARLNQAEEEARRILERGRHAGEEVREKMLRRAREEAHEQIERAKREIALARDQAVEEIRVRAVDLALLAATHVLGRSLTGEDHRRLAREAINAAERLE